MLFSFKSKKVNKIIEICLIVIVFTWPLCFLLRSIDHMDSGYYLANYKYFFNSNVNNDVLFELSNFCGALFYKLAPECKFIFFRFLDYLFNCIAWIFTYKLAKGLIPNVWIWGSILIASFAIRIYPMMLSYNTFSFTLLIIALYFLKQGVENNNKKHLSISGLIIGLNVMFRLPNVLQALFVFIPFLSVLAFPKEKRATSYLLALNQSIRFTIAGFIGLAIGILITICADGLDGIYIGFNRAIELSNDHTHSFSVVFYNILLSIKSSAIYLRSYALPFILLIIFIMILNKYAPKYINSLISVLCVICICALIYKHCLLLSADFFYNIIMFIIILPVLFIPFIRHNNSAIIYSFLSIICILTIPIGTDNGLHQLVFVLPLLIINVFSIFNNITVLNREWINKGVKTIINILSSILVFTIVVSFTTNYLLSSGYCDNRISKLDTNVNVPVLRGMKTEEYKARALEKFYEDINSDNYHKNKKIIVLGNFPLAYELCENEPFNGYIWPELKYKDSSAIIQMLENNKEYPIIVVGKFRCFRFEIQSNVDAYIEYARAHQYTVIDNECYTIYFPNKVIQND